jgi:putative transposase
MIDKSHDLPVSRQAAVLGISRGSVYYLPRAVGDADLALMRRIDELHLDYPFAGSRMLQGLLTQEGHQVGRLHVATLMRKMGIEAIYRRPNTSKPEPGHKVFPYLLRKLAVTRPNQVWAMDITYIPMARGFVYLAAVIDWFSRKVLAWRLSITMDVGFCIEAVEEAMARFGKPEIFNTDQGSQFTSRAFTMMLIGNGVAISMDGKGAWRDNVFVERLWRSLKHEEVYLRAYASVTEARASIGRYLDFYNRRRPHQGLAGQTPDQAFITALQPIPAAA